jgi:hypothetical protein
VEPGIGRIPVNVALTWRWTWFCSSRFFSGPRANRLGYRRIAGTHLRSCGVCSRPDPNVTSRSANASSPDPASREPVEDELSSSSVDHATCRDGR